MTFQIPDNQIIMPSVKEEIDFGLSHLTLRKYDVQKKIDYALSILKVKSTQPCHSLSAEKSVQKKTHAMLVVYIALRT